MENINRNVFEEKTQIKTTVIIANSACYSIQDIEKISCSLSIEDVIEAIREKEKKFALVGDSEIAQVDTYEREVI